MPKRLSLGERASPIAEDARLPAPVQVRSTRLSQVFPSVPMNATVHETFSDEEIVLDYQKYVECTFEECVIVYHGDGPTAADECQFKDCRFDFRDSASVTFSTLRSFFHGGLEEVAVDVLASIVAAEDGPSPLQVLENEGEARLVLDLGPVDPSDFIENGQHGP